MLYCIIIAYIGVILRLPCKSMYKWCYCDVKMIATTTHTLLYSALRRLLNNEVDLGLVDGLA